jgi:citrate lyase subunit beta/citryl-CoA lyase
MLDIADLNNLEIDALKSKRLGFGGKICIHPNQIEIVNRVFSPSQDDIAKAQSVLKAFDEAESNGLGAIQLAGIFIDKPIVERSRKILQMANKLNPTN